MVLYRSAAFQQGAPANNTRKKAIHQRSTHMLANKLLFFGSPATNTPSHLGIGYGYLVMGRVTCKVWSPCKAVVVPLYFRAI